MKNLFVVFVALIMICFIPLKIFLRIYRDKDKVTVSIRTIFWFIPLKVHAVNPITTILWKLSVNRFWKKKTPQDLPGTKIPVIRLFLRVKHINEVRKTVQKASSRVFRKLGSKIKLTALRLYIELGLDNAAQSAQAVGCIWWLLSLMQSQTATFFNCEEMERDINIIPIFQQDRSCVLDCACIFKMRLGHIIIILFYVLRSGNQIYSILRRTSQ